MTALRTVRSIIEDMRFEITELKYLGECADMMKAIRLARKLEQDLDNINELLEAI